MPKAERNKLKLTVKASGASTYEVGILSDTPEVKVRIIRSALSALWTTCDYAKVNFFDILAPKERAMWAKELAKDPKPDMVKIVDGIIDAAAVERAAKV
jgi:hypothetical protein